MKPLVNILISGAVSGAAYLAAQAVDIWVTGNRIDDRLLLGRLLPLRRSKAAMAGTLMHLANSVLFSAAFRLIGRDRLTGPMWWRGLIFANLENVVLYPLALLEDFHPAIRDGHLASYQSSTAFVQQVWRHTVLGVVLGLLTPKRG